MTPFLHNLFIPSPLMKSCFCIALLCFQAAFGQKSDKITLEQVAEKCKDLPLDKRVTVKVARFSVSTKSVQAHATFGDELATMLTYLRPPTNQLFQNVGNE